MPAVLVQDVAAHFVITDEQNEANAFQSGVNHLALGQVETMLALLRSSLANPSRRDAATRRIESAERLADVIRVFMSRYAARGAEKERTASPLLSHLWDAANAKAGPAAVQLSSDFRVAASSIAPCVEAVVFSIANTPWATDVKLWWDDELVVLVNVTIHAMANLLHFSPLRPSPNNVAPFRVQLLSAFEFLLNHDPESFGTMDFMDFVAIADTFESTWRELYHVPHHSAAGIHISTHKQTDESDDVPYLMATVVAAADELLRNVWSLTSSFFSQTSYFTYFRTVRAAWQHSDAEEGHSEPLKRDSSGGGSVSDPLFVARMLYVCSPPPAAIEVSQRQSELKADYRRQRTQERRDRSRGDVGSVKFVRASYLRATDATAQQSEHSGTATAGDEGEDEYSPLGGLASNSSSLDASRHLGDADRVPHDMFCADRCCSDAATADALLDFLAQHAPLRPYAEAFAKRRLTNPTWLRETAASPALLLAKPIPLQSAEDMFAYTTALIAVQGQRSAGTLSHLCDAALEPFSVTLANVSSLMITGSIDATDGFKPSTSVFSQLRSVFHHPALEVMKPFACFQLYGMSHYRKRFVHSSWNLSLQDHELLLDYLSTLDQNGSSLLALSGGTGSSQDHPLEKFFHGVRLVRKLAMIIDKQLSGSRGYCGGHALFMSLLDNHGDVVDTLSALQKAHQRSGSSAGDAVDSTVSMVDTQSIIPQILALLSNEVPHLRGPHAQFMPQLAANIDRQIVLLRAVVVVKNVVDKLLRSGGEGDETTAAKVGFEDVVKRFADSAAAAKPYNPEFVSCAAEALVDMVVMLGANLNLSARSSGNFPPAPSSAASVVSATTGTPMKRNTASLRADSKEPSPTAASRSRFSAFSTTTESEVAALSLLPQTLAGDLPTFCSIVTCLKVHLAHLLSDDVRALLQDLVFRATQCDAARSAEASLLEEAGVLSKTEATAFERSPYRFLLDAALTKDPAKVQEVLTHLFCAPSSPASARETPPPHPVLLFTFLSTRLRALSDGSLSLPDFLLHVQLLRDALQVPMPNSAASAAIPTSDTSEKAAMHSKPAVPLPRPIHRSSVHDSVFLRLEELWFHCPAAVAACLETNSSFVKAYQQSILHAGSDLGGSSGGGTSEIRAVSKRFEDAMRSLGSSTGVGDPHHQHVSGIDALNRASFLSYLRSTEDVKCSAATLEAYLKSVDRLARVSCSTSAKTDDLLPLLSSVAVHLDGEASHVWCPVFPPPADSSALNQAPKVSTVVHRLRDLAELIRRTCGGTAEPPIPSIVQRGHELIFDAVAHGRVSAAVIADLSQGSRELLLRITVIEFYRRSGSANRQTTPSIALTVQEEHQIGALLSAAVSPHAALMFMLLFASPASVAEVAHAPWVLREAKKTAALQNWLAARWSLLETLQSAVSGKDQSFDSVVEHPAARAAFLFSIDAQMRAVREVFSMLCSASSRDDSCLLQLCRKLPLNLVSAALRPESPSSEAESSALDSGDNASVPEVVLDAILTHLRKERQYQMASINSNSLAPPFGTKKPVTAEQSLSSLAEGQAQLAGDPTHYVGNAFYVIAVELVLLQYPVPTIISSLDPSRSTSGPLQIHDLFPYDYQAQLLQRCGRKLALEVYLDPEDDDASRETAFIHERQEQIALCRGIKTSLADLVGATCKESGANDPAAADEKQQQLLPPLLCSLMVDPISLTGCLTSFRATDEALRLAAEQNAFNKVKALRLRTQHMTLIRANCTEADTPAVVGQLAVLYSEYLRSVRDEAVKVGGTSTKVDFLFMREFSSLVKRELAAAPRTSGALIQRLVELLVCAKELPLSVTCRVVQFVRESTMTAALFASNASLRVTSVGLQVLSLLARRDAVLDSAEAARGASSASAATMGSARATESPIQSPPSIPSASSSGANLAGAFPAPLSSLFDCTFITKPLIVVENLIAGQRISSLAAILPILATDEALAAECDALLLCYAEKAVIIQDYVSNPKASELFPFGKLLTDEARRKPVPYDVPPLHAVLFASEESEAARLDKRTDFRFRFTPNIPLFRCLLQLISPKIPRETFVYRWALNLFDSLALTDNFTLRAVIIDTAEQVLSSLAQDLDAPSKQLAHWLVIARHLVVCKWSEHPSRQDLESEEGVRDLITSLLEHGHNNGALSIAAACDMDLNMIHNLWTNRTVHLLSLGLFEEAATTLSTLPNKEERVAEILKDVLESIECVPVPIGYRAVTQNGQYHVKPQAAAAAGGGADGSQSSAAAAATAAEIQSAVAMRRLGVRSLLTRFGSVGDVVAFCVRSNDFVSALPLLLQVKKDDEVLLRDFYLPVEQMQTVDLVRRAMLHFDPTLERVRSLIIFICRHLEGRQEYERLLSWQEFMCDHARAAQTCTLLATLPAEGRTPQQRVEYVARSEKHFIEAKFQPASKQAPPQHSDDGILLPPTRLDAQQLARSLLQSRLQREIWNLLLQHHPQMDPLKVNIYGEEDHLAKVIVDLFLLGKHFFEVTVKVVTNLGVNVQHVFAPVALQLVRNKKHDVLEQLLEFLKKTILLGPVERNAVLFEVFKGCHEESTGSTNPKKATKLRDATVECMTSEGGYKARCYMLVRRWLDALQEAFASKDKQVILDLHELAVKVVPQDDETVHVLNATRQFLARNNLR